MIGFLSGRLIKATGGQIILSVHGRGYELSCSEMSLREIENKKFVQLWVYTYVKEDKIQLFGFSSEREKKVVFILNTNTRHWSKNRLFKFFQ